MTRKHVLPVLFVGLMSLWPLQAQEKPVVQIPDPGVPEVRTMEGKFVRAAYNREGYVILGYQATNRSVGEEWMLVEIGATVVEGNPAYTLKREHLSLASGGSTSRCRSRS